MLVSLACSGQAYAANVPEFAGDPVVVTAGRVAQSLSRTLADATVVTREEIEESGAQTLQQVLSRQAAVSIASNGGPGSASSIYIRGNKDSHTVVLVDGVRIYSATLGTTTIQNIPLAQIERIEILRGPASSLYGADAIGGV
ncbi:TonB-dependent receptor plug domain-containing protein, partial [Chromobacterium haemolyticum]|uniref:TonB-dependent receptor plug domain-containing protein n=1 Tax=Chromobacterium haemolyticum TaxID=394935 RepID=UPI001930A9F6